MRIGFYADDLTGASDVLAQAHRHGLDAALVLDPAAGLPAADVVGVAGHARSLAGPDLDAAVTAGLVPLVAAGPDVLLYKVCSTFDSSPTTGSIGRGIELLRAALGPGPVPVCPAQPDFGRYTAFATHFGRAGDAVHRLDRHPVMSRHPSTPMHEADLRRVLSAQLAGGPDVPALMLPELASTDADVATAWDRVRDAAASAGAFVVDAVTDAHLDRVAARLAATAPTAPVVGSGGIMAALARRVGDPAGAPPSGHPAREPSGPVLVVSGSASAVTGSQIDHALAHGFTGVEIPLTGADGSWTDRAREALAAGHDVVAHTTRGPDDPRLTGPVDPAAVGALLAGAVAAAVGAGLTRDVVICGGDTSGHALAALAVRELRVAEQFVPVGPVCRTDDASDLAGCRVVLKGGQVGPPDMLARFAARAAGTGTEDA